MTHRYKYKIEYTIFRPGGIVVIICAPPLLYLLSPIITGSIKTPLKETLILGFVFFLLVASVVIVIHDFWKNFSLYKFQKRNPDIIVDEDSIHLQEEKDKKRIQIFFKDIIVIKEFVEADDENTETFFYIVQEVQAETSECFFFKSQMDADEYNRFRDLLLLETKQKSPLINLDEDEDNTPPSSLDDKSIS